MSLPCTRTRCSREEVEATSSMFFPRQHPERDVAVVLQAGEVGLLSVPSADVRSAAKAEFWYFPTVEISAS